MNFFQSQFESVLKSFPTQGAELLELRQRSFRRFQELGFPNRKWEDWQFTNFTPLKKETFALATEDQILPEIDTLIPALSSNSYLVILNGRFQQNRSKLPPEITVHNLLEASTPKDVQFDGEADRNPFKVLNSALMTTALVVEIPPGTFLDSPLHILYLSTESKQVTMSHPRVRISVGAQAKVTLCEHFLGRTDRRYWNNLATHIDLGENAMLDHISMVEEGVQADHISATDYFLSRNSRLNAFHFSMDGRLNRTDLTLSMEGAGSEAILSGLTLLKDQQHSDIHVVVDHKKPNCTSRQTFRNILSDRSSGVFSGRVIVRPGSQKTDARQGNKNLLLSDQTLMHSNPQLEIYADDVKCAHGSSSGQLDEEALFYLQARGIHRREAQQLIVQGFARELFKNLLSTAHKEYLENRLTDWLQTVYSPPSNP